jgi:hypothetical protein
MSHVKREANIYPAESLRPRGQMVALVLIAVGLQWFGSGVGAAHAETPPPPIAQFAECADVPDTGIACGHAGGVYVPRGIAVNPLTGNVYVADQANSRVSEFSPWGVFIRAWGWGVRDGAAELQTCTSATKCQEGLEGSGAGEFARGVVGIALDSVGDLFVVDANSHRVQKFDSEGHFLLMFGGGVDQGPHHLGDVCTAVFIVEGDTCGAGSVGSAAGQFGDWPYSSFIAVGPGDKVYVGDQERIQLFDVAGAYVESLPLPGETVQSLAVDKNSGDLYVTFVDPKPCTWGFPECSLDGVRKLSPAGVALATFPVIDPQALATDALGNVYVINGSDLGETATAVRKFSSAGTESTSFTFSADLVKSTALATSSACGVEGSDIYISNLDDIYHPVGEFVGAYGPPPNASVCPPPKVPPVIASQYAVSANDNSALVKAAINPRFWPDTTYYVQYGTGSCYEGGCADEQPAAPGAKLTDTTTGQSATTPGIPLTGLKPDTIYHYRFVAVSSGGGPVRGVGGEVGHDGAEGTFTTFPVPSGATTDCPNQPFRAGISALLPDCRAYEMVSPVEKAGSNIAAPETVTLNEFNGQYYPARIDQATPEGEGITYSTGRAFGEAESAPWSSQYIARRDSVGWSTQVINPPLDNISIYGSRSQEIPFRAFSEDLCSSWFQQQTTRTLTQGAPEGVPNLYRRRDCTDGGYELLTTAPPAFPVPLNEEYLPEIQGATIDGAHSFVRANGALTSDASPNDTYQLYETSESGALRLVSVLPDGIAANTNSSLGTARAGKGDFHNDSVTGAISEDGSRVFWSARVEEHGSITDGGVYLRADPLAEPSTGGGCDEAGRACTLAISGTGSVFWAASPDGSRVIYQTGEKLFEAQIEEEGEELTSRSTEIAGGVDGLLGASTDTNRIYLVSSETLSPGEKNAEGLEAVLGKPNLYLYEAGATPAFTFITTLSTRELSEGGYSLDALASSRRHSRVSPSGEQAVFVSQASLTGYDNTDVNSGEPDYEVFLYEAGMGAGRLHCISCNPTGARPAGQKIGQVSGQYWAAAEIPGWAYRQHASRVLSDDGSRLFFESYDALLPSDTNGVRDVYEWERAADQKGCNELGATLYVESAGGCLSLISSGQSPQASEFIDASSDGHDVFFTTNQSLVSEDPGLVDLYDARIDGGFPVKTQASVCEGEACQSAPSPPSDATPASAIFSGPGDLVATLTASTTATHKKKLAPAQLRAQRLAKALKVCEHRARAKRRDCEALVRKRYGARSHRKATKASKEGGR